MNPLRGATVALLLGLLGCAHAPPRPDVVWPSPPDVARIKFVSAFRNGDDLDQSGWAAFGRTVLGKGSSVAMAQPMGLAISDDGQRLYIADFSMRAVLVADFAAKTMRVFAPEEPMGKPFNVALDGAEQVYVSDSAGRVVRVFSKAGAPLRQIGQGKFERPTGLAIDRERRRLYVSDSATLKSLNHRVRVFDLEGNWISDLGATADRPGKGQEDGQWYFPTYIALDPAGNVYVADTMNFRIQVFDANGTFVRKFGENGDSPGNFARLKGLAIDGFGNLYVVDGGHSNVQMFNKNFAALMYFGGYAQKLEYFDVPSAIAIDRRTNKIYVGNEFISRVNVYELINTKPEDSVPSPAAAAPAPTGSADPPAP